MFLNSRKYLQQLQQQYLISLLLQYTLHICIISTHSKFVAVPTLLICSSAQPPYLQQYIPSLFVAVHTLLICSSAHPPYLQQCTPSIFVAVHTLLICSSAHPPYLQQCTPSLFITVHPLLIYSSAHPTYLQQQQCTPSICSSAHTPYSQKCTPSLVVAVHILLIYSSAHPPNKSVRRCKFQPESDLSCNCGSSLCTLLEKLYFKVLIIIHFQKDYFEQLNSQLQLIKRNQHT